jgi:hypothetical protein
MGDEPSVGRRKQKKAGPVLSPEAEARMTRRLTVLLGLVPLPQMSQDETDWLFRQRQRTPSDRERET